MKTITSIGKIFPTQDGYMQGELEFLDGIRQSRMETTQEVARILLS